MSGVMGQMRGSLPPARHPTASESQEVMDYVVFVVELCTENMAKVKPEYAHNWFYILVAALNVTIALRDGKLTGGPVFQKYGMAARDIKLAYADHYLQMRSDAFNLGPVGAPMLRNAVYSYDVAKQLNIAPKTGSAPVSPPTQLSIFWGLQGIKDGLEDDRLVPRDSGGPRCPGPAAFDEVMFALQTIGVLVGSGPATWFNAIKEVYGGRPGH
jgi:hypothetical protein